PETPADVFDAGFVARFGPEAGPLVERALHRASGVLPRIVAACYPYDLFPMTRGWAEKQVFGELPHYAGAQGSDVAVFESFDEEAQNLLSGIATAKVRPGETARFFAAVHDDLTALLAQADERVGGRRSKEYVSTVTDIR